MCLTTVYFVDGDGKAVEVMRDVAWMDAEEGGYVLMNLFGQRKTVSGKIKSIDFSDQHKVVIEG